MLLKRILILNYQSLQNVELDLQVDSPTVLIGINDSGKSIILKAVGLLLSSSPQFAFQREGSIKRDLSNTVLEKESFETRFSENNLPALPYDEHEAVVAGEFIIETADFEEELTTELSNQLLWAIEKSKDSTIWLAKVFNNVAGTSEVYLLCQDVNSSNSDLQELWNKKSSELTSLRKKLAVTDKETENLNKAGRFKNLEQMRALYTRGSLQYQWRKYLEYKKDIEYFLQYRYLGWEFSLDELKKLAGDAMKNIIDQHSTKVKTVASAEAQQAEKELNEKLASYVSLLKEDVPTLTSLQTRLAFELKPNVSDILLNKINADKSVHLDSQGEGVKRQIWFGLIRIAALQSTEGNKNIRHQFFWCFDEPETHLYPAAQRKFFEAIKSLSLSSFQIALSTHSAIFVDRAKLGNINNVRLEEGYTKIGICSEVEDVFEALQIKNSDFLFFDKFLLVEGETEEALLPGLFQLETQKSFGECGIQIIPLGGKSERKRNFDNITKLLRDFQKPDERIITILDNDASFCDESDKVKGKNIFYVGKQDIDDAIPSSVWQSVLKKRLPEIEITEEEIEHVKAQIPSNKSIPRSNKFFPRLKALLISKAGENENLKDTVKNKFPPKGNELGRLLLAEMKKMKGEIPAQIKSVFDRLI